MYDIVEQITIIYKKIEKHLSQIKDKNIMQRQ